MVRKLLIKRGDVIQVERGSIPWFHLANAVAANVDRRLSELDALHQQTQDQAFVMQVGQALEIATFRALQSQSSLAFFGNFPDLAAHDDSKLYRKEEPPSSLSGREIPSGKKLDFLVQHGKGGYAGIEVKNIREWFYPNRPAVRAMLLKCCYLDVVPVLIARRIHFSSFSVLNPCGVILHETFNQLYPNAAKDLADKVRAKTSLGYHDVRVGNIPDARLLRFIHTNLPAVLPNARKNFVTFRDLLCGYATGANSYPAFAALVKRRMRGESEEEADLEDESENYELLE